MRNISLYFLQLIIFAINTQRFIRDVELDQLRGQEETYQRFEDSFYDDTDNLETSIRRSKEDYLKKVEIFKGLRTIQKSQWQDGESLPKEENWDELNSKVQDFLQQRRLSKKDVNSKDEEGRLPSTFLSPPPGGRGRDSAADQWSISEVIKAYKEEKRKAELLTTTTSAPESGPSQAGAGSEAPVTRSSLGQSLLAARHRLEQEAAKLSVKAQSTIQRIKQLTNSSHVGDTCQSAEDCGENQICYLPTNTCKDQLSFPVKERTAFDCSNSTDCNSNEICYLPDKKCVCQLGSVESQGKCITPKSLNCSDAVQITKIIDNQHWGVTPYCSAWGNSTLHGDKNGMLSYGDYVRGSGLSNDPMLFTGGSEVSCKQKRSSQVFYDCYCDEFGCDDSAPPQHNNTQLWWGEFDPCQYTAYVYSPLACDNLVA